MNEEVKQPVEETAAPAEEAKPEATLEEEKPEGVEEDAPEETEDPE